MLRNGLKQIFRCALVGVGVSLEPCQFSYFKVSKFHDCDNGNRS